MGHSPGDSLEQAEANGLIDAGDARPLERASLKTVSKGITDCQPTLVPSGASGLLFGVGSLAFLPTSPGWVSREVLEEEGLGAWVGHEATSEGSVELAGKDCGVGVAEDEVDDRDVARDSSMG